MDPRCDSAHLRKPYLQIYSNKRRQALLLAMTLASLNSAGAQEQKADSAVQFSRDVVPILRDKCISCHGPKIQQAGLRLDARFEMLRGGKSGPAILENDDSKSLLIRRVSGSEAGMQMPPTGALTEKEIGTLRTWIRDGAPWDAAASFAKDRPVASEAKVLFDAIRRGQVSEMRKILDRDPKLIASVDENGSSPLILAAYCAGPREVKELLARGADPNAKNDGGVAALIPATDNLETTRLLVEAGAAINSRTEAGDNALMIAARRPGAAPVADYLIAKGAEVNASTQDGTTALHRAAQSGDLEMIGLLLKHGAQVNAQRKNGRTPLASAVVFGRGAAVKQLLAKGAKATLGEVGLERAVFQGNFEIVEALLEAGAEIKTKREEEPILVSACFSYSADPQIVRILLARGADPTAKSLQGKTPLELARERGNEAVANLLVQAVEQKTGAEKGKP